MQLTHHLMVCCLLITGSNICLAEEQESDPDLLVVLETRWGFDTTVQLSSFVPLSIHLQNAAPIPWAGTLALTRSTPESHLGVPLQMSISLQPNEDRWVQMLPFVIDEIEDWTLSWGPGKSHRVQLSNLQKGKRPTVLIIDTDQVSPAGGVLRSLPEQLFPTSIIGTETLRGVILNYSPFWQGARAQAFSEWLYAGGRVYILHGDHAAYPHFNKPLDFLNSEKESFSVGRGQVKKLPYQVDKIDLGLARQLIFNDDWIPQPEKKRRLNDYRYDYGFSSSWNRYSELFRELRPITIYKRRWWLIYLAAFGYLFVLFKCYQVGRNSQQVSYFYSAFFVSVLVFSGIFIALGQLGASVQNRLRSVSLVQHVQDDSYEVTDWCIAANVNANEYELAYAGSGNAITTCSELESVAGRVDYGRETRMTLKMPPATLRPYMQRRRVSLANKKPVLQSIERSVSGISELKINVDGCFQTPVLRAFAIHRGTVYPLSYDNSVLGLSKLEKPGSLVNELSRVPTWNMPNTNSGLFRIRRLDQQERLSEDVHYETMLKSLVGNSYGFTNEISQRQLQSTTDVMRLAIYVSTPRELHCTTPDFPDQQGCALYVYDLPVAQ